MACGVRFLHNQSISKHRSENTNSPCTILGSSSHRMSFLRRWGGGVDKVGEVLDKSVGDERGFGGD